MKELAVLNPGEWQAMKEQAAMLVRSGLLPYAIKTPEQAITIGIKSRELGIGFMQGLSSIHVIKGRPTISSELMLALIYRDMPDAVINFKVTDIHECVIEASRNGKHFQTFRFGMDDAERAGLKSNDTWKKYPAAMCRARCISVMARAVFPDCIAGCSYTPEEIDNNLVIDEEGEYHNVGYQSNRTANTRHSGNSYQKISKKASVSPRSPKPAFDSSNERHKEALLNILEKRDIEHDYYDKIVELMQGRHSDALDACIEEAKEIVDSCFLSSIEEDQEIVDVAEACEEISDELNPDKEEDNG
jgi:hypothetical protein